MQSISLLETKMNKARDTKNYRKSEKALLPLLVLYLLASGSVFEKVSATGGIVMIAIGLIMGAYAYLKHKSILEQSVKDINQPLGGFIWNSYIPFVIKYWVTILIVMIVAGIFSAIYISSVSNKAVQLGHTSAAFNLCLNSTNCPPPRYAN